MMDDDSGIFRYKFFRFIKGCFIVLGVLSLFSAVANGPSALFAATTLGIVALCCHALARRRWTIATKAFLWLWLISSFIFIGTIVFGVLTLMAKGATGQLPIPIFVPLAGGIAFLVCPMLAAATTRGESFRPSHGSYSSPQESLTSQEQIQMDKPRSNRWVEGEPHYWIVAVNRPGLEFTRMAKDVGWWHTREEAYETWVTYNTCRIPRRSGAESTNWLIMSDEEIATYEKKGVTLCHDTLLVFPFRL